MSLSPPPPPPKPRGARCAPVLLSSLYLSLFSASGRVFSIDPRKYLVFHHHRIPSSIFSSTIASFSSLCSLSLSPSPSPSLSSAAFFVIRASHARISCFPENSSLATTATKEEGGRRGGKRTKGESSEIDRFSSKEARRFSTSSARTEPRAVRRVDVRFRVNWISSAFLFSN
jgi:hypothetical protein